MPTRSRASTASRASRGTGFGHFAAFLSRGYRENDYLLGRLHALDRLIDIVCDAAGIDGHKDEIGLLALKKRGFTRILDAEEKHLTHSAESGRGVAQIRGGDFVGRVRRLRRNPPSGRADRRRITLALIRLRLLDRRHRASCLMMRRIGHLYSFTSHCETPRRCSKLTRTCLRDGPIESPRLAVAPFPSGCVRPEPA